MTWQHENLSRKFCPTWACDADEILMTMLLHSPCLYRVPWCSLKSQNAHFLLEGARFSQFIWQMHSANLRKLLSCFKSHIIPRMSRALEMTSASSSVSPFKKGTEGDYYRASLKASLGPDTSFTPSYFNLTQPVRWVLFSPELYRWENWGPEKWRDVHKALQPDMTNIQGVKGRPQAPYQLSSFPRHPPLNSHEGARSSQGPNSLPVNPGIACACLHHAHISDSSLLLWGAGLQSELTFLSPFLRYLPMGEVWPLPSLRESHFLDWDKGEVGACIFRRFYFQDSGKYLDTGLAPDSS